MIHLSENPHDVLRHGPQQRGREVKQGHPPPSVAQIVGLFREPRGQLRGPKQWGASRRLPDVDAVLSGGSSMTVILDSD